MNCVTNWARRLAIAAWLAPAMLVGCGKGGQHGTGGGTTSTAPAALSEKDVEQAIVNLGDRDKRVDAMHKLGQAKILKAARPILGHLRDEDPRIRQASAWALGEIGDANDRILQSLAVAVTQEKSVPVATEAARSLGKLRDVKSAFGLVEGGLTHYAEEVRQASADSLVSIGPAASLQVRKALGHEREVVRVLAASVLGRMKDAASVEPLLAALRDDQAEAVRAAAAEALASIGTPTVEPLVAILLLRNPSATFKSEGIDVLKKIGLPAAEPMARRLAEAMEFATPADVAAMVAVLGQIGRKGDPDTAAALQKAAKHYAPEVKKAAQEAEAALSAKG